MQMVTASVVLYNTPKSQIDALFDSILHSSVELYLYVVDNSPEGYVPDLSALPASRFKYVKTGKNSGYGSGHNIALRDVLESSDFHFVLNPDIHFGPNELEKMLEFMRDNGDVGQLMPKVLYADGSLQYLCKLIPNPVDLFLRRFSVIPFMPLLQKRMERFELRFTGYKKVMDVPYLSGCFMLFRVPALRVIGLFDERFFMYLEDVDLTRRVNAEFRTVFFPDACIVHHHARESYKNTRSLWIHVQNLIRYFNKWGWIRDPERTRVNRKVLRELQ
jgi:GT2 family glycosyltransferase